MEEIINVIKTLDSGNGNTFQLYGVACTLLENKKCLKELQKILIDILLSNIKKLEKDKNITCVLEGKNNNNYYISHYYNFSLNILCYFALKKIRKETNYRYIEIDKLLKDIIIFLNYEKDFLNNDEKKTIAFELVIGKYITKLDSFKDNIFVNKYIKLRKSRLKKISPIIVFSPEGVSGFFPQIKSYFLAKKLLKKTNDPRNYLFCSPQTTIKYIGQFEKKFPGSIKQIIKYIKQNKGMPPKFNAEFFDIFWSLDILESTDQIYSYDINKEIIAILNKIELFNNNIGCFNIKKGFSISKGFPLYDLDTTSVAIKTLYSINYKRKILDNFDFKYYKNTSNNLYYTYKNDNRISISMLAHTLHAQIVLNKIDKNLLEYLNQRIFKSNYLDKFHASELYSIYCLVNAYTDLVIKTTSKRDVLEKLLRDLLLFKKNNNLFGSIEGLNGTVEETAWAILSIYRYLKVNPNSYIKKYISLSQNSIKENLKPIEELEKEWIIKDIYTPYKINTVLINCALSV